MHVKSVTILLPVIREVNLDYSVEIKRNKISIVAVEIATNMLNERLSSSDKLSGDNEFSGKSQKRTKIRKRTKMVKSVNTPCHDNDERITVENNEVKIL